MGGAGVDVASMLEAAEAALASGDHGTAMMQFQEVMSAAPESVAALAGVVRCLSASGDNAGAREGMDSIGALNPSAIPRLRRPERTLMSKSNLEDGVADAIAATALISVALVTLMIWLSGLPS